MTFDELSPELKQCFKQIRKAITILEEEGLTYESDFLEMTFDHIKQNMDFE